jgi:acyl-CoA synthetase (AMP-forming)/AMP-acid ligase II
MVTNGTTLYNGAPTHYAMMCQLPRTEVTDRVAVDVMITAGSPLTQEKYRQFRERWPRTAISNWYALNETMVGQTLNYGAGMDRDPCAVGTPVWPTEVRIIDPDGADKPPGEDGEVLLRSPGQMMGYFHDDAETAQRIQDGWIHTGDCGNLSPDDGQLRLTGRVVERINRGAFKFYPAEVEAVLLEHPSVIDSAVIGVPHEFLGQDAVAFVVLRDRTDSGQDASEMLREHCRGHLARNKVPGAIVVLEKMPRSGYGKVLKNELRLQWGALTTDSLAGPSDS